MKTRKRFKRSRLASTDNYKASKRVHRQELLLNHLLNKEYFEEVERNITVDITMIKTPHVRIWGELVKIERVDIPKYESVMTIIWL